MPPKYPALIAALLAAWLPAIASEQVGLSDMAAFRPAAENWSIAGGVSADPGTPADLRAKPGTGVLVNLPDGDDDGNLVSRFEHGDADLALEFMMARGSNSGLYLQGRYEVQLSDSWGVGEPAYSDCAGVYQRRRPDGSQFEGAAPRMNACKAPGLWQRLEVSFRAPRFDGEGRKTENARLLAVRVNGVLVHENLVLTGPTGGPISNDEVPLGPIMIQGDHGPVALRNIRYTPYDKTPPVLDVGYRVYYDSKAAPLSGFDVLVGREPDAEGSRGLITHDVSRYADGFAVIYDGEIAVSAAGEYSFELAHVGSARLAIAGKEILGEAYRLPWEASRQAGVALDQGKHRFTLVYFKKGGEDWSRALEPALALHVTGPGFRRVALNQSGGTAPAPDPILVDADTVRIVRSFVDVAVPGGAPRRIVHAVNVGAPDGLHYTLDYDRATVAQAWRGEFLDATSMWHDRGDGSAGPRGAVQVLATKPLVATLADDRTPWPSDFAEGEFRPLRYTIDSSGLPVFEYAWRDARITDTIGSADGRRIDRVLEIDDAPRRSHVLLAEAAVIERIKPGWYAIGDRSYYVEIGEAGRVFVRESGGLSQLVGRPGGDGRLRYGIVF